jgi:hypothetical protein
MAPGRVKRATLKDSKSPFHGSEYSELHGKSAFCGNCHNIFHPDNRFPVEHTYDEWKASPYAQSGVQCQDCHMVPVDIAIRVADEMKPVKELANHGLGGKAGRGAKVEREVVHDHGFVGGNTVIAEALGVEGAAANKAEAIKRLQSAAELDFEIVPGKGGVNQLKVKVSNVRAGHHLPTSLTFIRQLWLEIRITDDQGNELLSSGVAKDNRVPADAVMFTNRSVDKEGKPYGADNNPKRPGSKTFDRFVNYKNGMTVAQAMEAGVQAGDLPPVASTLSVMFIPVIGVFSGALWLGEVLYWQDWTAVALIALAIATVLWPARQAS